MTKNLFSVEGKIVVLTGSGGLLGQQFRQAFEENGATVVDFDLKSEIPVDITDENSVENAVQAALAAHGRIDVLIHCAAMDAPPGGNRVQFAPYEEFSVELWEKEIRVNLTGSFIVTRQVAPHMMRQRSGSVIFISSDLGMIAPNNTIYETGNFKDIAYVSSKSGILGLMRSWASYLSPHGVRVNALVPGGVFNNQNEEFVKKNVKLNMMGRMARKDEYNGAVLFLASEASSYMTGASMVVDGGRTAW